MSPLEFEGTGGRDYEGYFGKGNTLKDYRDIVTEKGFPPTEIFSDGHTRIALVYPDEIIIVGYDGSEFFDDIRFTRFPPERTEAGRSLIEQQNQHIREVISRAPGVEGSRP